MKTVGVGTRTVNFLIDTVVVALIAYLAYKVNSFYAFHYRTPFFQYSWFFAATIVVYYTVAEGFTGRSLGKKFSYTVVVTASGRKPGFLRVLARSLLRLTVIDLFFIPFFERPLHDIATGTYVVEI